MTSIDDVADRWAGRALGTTDRNPLSTRGGRVYSDWEHRIFSYGSHFELGRFLFHKNGQPRAILLNGNRYSVTTSRHQSIVRGAARRTALPVVIIPYSALQAAGIDLDSIELVDVRPDRWVEKVHEFTEMQPGWRWSEVPVYDNVDLSADEVEALAQKRLADEYAKWQSYRRYAVRDREAGGESLWSDYLAKPAPTLEEVRAKMPSSQMRQYRLVRYERRLYTSGRRNQQVDIIPQPDGSILYSWTTRRHWLGGALIRAAVPSGIWSRCKTCNTSGHAAEIHCVAPPDIPCTTWEHRCRDCSGRGQKAAVRRRRAYFISDFDHNEPRELYFFCELPRGPQPTTLAEAIEVLKPDTVRMAEQMGRSVKRQGDIFAVQLKAVDKRTLGKAGASFEKGGRLLGTNHVATEVARLPSGQTLVRGVLRHDPHWRRPDHVRVKLDRGWHVVVRNTVPVAA